MRRTIHPDGTWSAAYDVTGMSSPVLCRRCGKAYDLGMVEVTARYADCTAYVTPCCKRSADDRAWVPSPAFTRLTRDGRVAR